MKLSVSLVAAVLALGTGALAAPVLTDANLAQDASMMPRADAAEPPTLTLDQYITAIQTAESQGLSEEKARGLLSQHGILPPAGYTPSGQTKGMPSSDGKTPNAKTNGGSSTSNGKGSNSDTDNGKSDNSLNSIKSTAKVGGPDKSARKAAFHAAMVQNWLMAQCKYNKLPEACQKLSEQQSSKMGTVKRSIDDDLLLYA